MKFRGRDVFKVHVPGSGITYTTDLEWRLAANWAGFRRFRDFERLDADEQSEIVATYRAQQRMTAVAEYEAIKESQNRMK